MNCFRKLAICLMALLLPLAGFAAEQPTKVGIVKGVITVGGRPTADAVASVEGIPQKDLKSQISNLKSLYDRRHWRGHR